jgi:hypothetical protein
MLFVHICLFFGKSGTKAGTKSLTKAVWLDINPSAFPKNWREMMRKLGILI